MSCIPIPDVVASGRMPTVELLQDVKDRLVQQLNDQFCASSSYMVVPFGSLVRGDATPRSDIDLCFALNLTGAEWDDQIRWHRIPIVPVEKLVKSIIGEQGVCLEANLVDWSSRVKDDRGRFYPSAHHSPTTYDHFSFFARDPRISEHHRDLYASIQREIRKYSHTDRESRERDIAHYVMSCRSRHIGDLSFSPHRAQTLGEIENEGYHILRKLAGLAKTFRNGDGKREIRRCFENSRIPFFSELLSYFDLVLQFSHDTEQVVAECLGQTSKKRQYELFLAERVPDMVQASQSIITLVDRHAQKRTLLEAVEDYDREGVTGVVVRDGFLGKIMEWFDEGERHFSVNWVVIGSEVALSRPYTTYSGSFDKRTGEQYKRGIGWDEYEWGRKINRRKMTGHGRFEIDLNQSLATLVCDFAGPENSGTPEMLARALDAVRTKLLELLAPLNVVYVEPPPKPKSIPMW